MRKYAFVALIILFASVIGGCGGSDSNNTVVVATTDAIQSASLISGKALYSVSSTSSPITYTFDTGTTTGTLTTGAITINGAPNGTWSHNATTGEITITPVTGSIMKFNRIQVESPNTTSEYWLMYDANAANKIYRFYVDQTNGFTAAGAYRTSITAPFGLTFPQFFMGGSVQGNPLTFAGTLDTIKVSTLSGSAIDTPAGHVDTKDISPTKLSILYNHPTGITTDGKGNLYVTDTANHVIRKIVINSGETSTIAGKIAISGFDDSTTSGLSATFSSPQGITCDGSSLYVTDTGNATIRKIDLATVGNPVSTLAGAVTSFGATDSTTSGADARFYTPVGITTDGTNLYVTDVTYNTIRKIKIATVSTSDLHSKSVTTLAGSPNTAGSADGTGTEARFNVPNRITTDGSNLYVTDFNNHTIRQIAIATGVTTTIAGAAGVGGSRLDEFGTAARFYYPSGIITDGINLFITEFNDTSSSSPNYVNVIRKLALSTKEVTTLAGKPSPDLISVDTLKGSPRFSKPIDIVSNGVSLFVSNYSRGYTDDVTKLVYPSFNNIRQISP